MSSRVSNRTVNTLDSPWNQKPFLKSKDLACPTCKKCIYSANHDECILKYLSKVNSRASAQKKDARSHKTTKRYIPVEKKSDSKNHARDKYKELDILEFKIRLYNTGGARGYELPTSNTLGVMVFESGISDNADFDVIIQHRDGLPQRVNKLHPLYMSLQFPLLFIYGQPGYHTELTLKSANGVEEVDVVGVLCAVEQNRLDYIRKKQNDIRSDYLSGLYDAISRGERDGYEVEGRIILPMSFTGGPRYMYAHYLDALAICRKLGNP
ncbi:DNA helicase [Tanacetum coccineum]